MAKPVRERVMPSSGNVFADLRLPDAAELDTKARLGATIFQIVKRRGLSQADAAALLGINQPKVSALLHFKLEGFSVERLIRFLVALDQDVEILVRRKSRSRPARVVVRITTERRRRTPFQLRKASWRRLRDAAYEGRGS